MRHGETHAFAKIADADVPVIRALYARGSASRADLAQWFGVSQGHIGRIVLGKSRSGGQENAL
jgi:phosphohistidine phosphatase SixA